MGKHVIHEEEEVIPGESGGGWKKSVEKNEKRKRWSGNIGRAIIFCSY